MTILDKLHQQKNWDEDESLVLDQVQRVVNEIIRPNAAKFDRTGAFPWENIEDVYVDETPAIKYGGAGIRTARIKGEWVLVYNVIGGPRVVLKLRVGKYKKFVFSTKNPEEVINVIKGQLVLT